MRKGIALVCAASMLVGMTAGMSFSAAAYEVDELKVAIWDNNQLAGIQEIADEWTAESGVKVQIDVVDWDNYWTLLEAGASDQSGMPDVFWMHSNVAQMYMENDILLNLDDYIAADDNIDLANYYEGVTDLFTRDDNGSVYALPKDHDTIALLYNKAIFDEYGVDYPTDDWTWEDVRDAAKAITEASEGKVYGYAINTVTATDANGNPVELTVGDTNGDHNGWGTYYTFTMPSSAVTINATFKQGDLYILGDANGNSWAGNVGVKMDYDSANEKYTKDVYFANDTYGYFSFTEHLGNADYSNMGTRYGASNNNQQISSGQFNLYEGQNSFKIPAGIYTIEVNKGKTRLTVTPKKITVTLTPNGGQVEQGTDVTVTSNLTALLHDLRFPVKKTAVS